MRKFSAMFVLSGFLAGCVSIPPDAFKLSQSSLEIRKMQTRKFETKDEVELLSAGAAQLQDMGYLIDETEKNVGLLVASKDADATDGGQVAAMITVAILTGAAPPIDKTQKIRVCFVTIPSRTHPGSYLARITFQRIVWNDRGRIARVETIQDPEIYQDFFSRLSKSVFLEANQI
jgi:hypothetical protein